MSSFAFLSPLMPGRRVVASGAACIKTELQVELTRVERGANKKDRAMEKAHRRAVRRSVGDSTSAAA